MKRLFTVVLIVPTGIGAAIGGYAGDALPVARAFASCCHRLITHPNILNGAQLFWPLENTFYVEGFALDKFAAGDWGLRPVHQNRIGLILDRGMEPELIARHLQAADAVRATLGLSMTDYVLTDAPLEVQLRTSATGASWGTIGNPDSLLRAAEVLINQAGAQAIAVVARFPDDPESLALKNYRYGQGVDPLAGAEAVISHLIVREFAIPCAHAPALWPLPLDPKISPRAAAEELGYTFLPCVLVGLSRAPQFITTEVKICQGLTVEDVDAVVVPGSACGGSALLSLSSRGVPVIAVQENTSRMGVPPAALGIKALEVQSYWEALGVVVAQQAGVEPNALRPVISRVNCLE